MKVGIFGGSFDPIHRGHVAGALAALRQLGLDRVLFLPTARPPHKPERRFAADLARYAMVELALLEWNALQVSTVELTVEQAAFTIETLERFRREAPGDELCLIVGSDSLAAFDSWRRWREILDTTELAVLVRPGFDWNDLAPRLPAELVGAVAAAKIHWIDSEPHPASASEIRRRLAAGEPLPADWLDPRVLAFVEKYSLYR